MKNLFLIVLLYLAITSCATKSKNNQTLKEKRITLCPEIHPNDYTKILFDEYKTVVGNDTITYNEIRYECLYSSFTTHKVMYDKFGKWNRAIFPQNSNLPILSWNNINLFNDGKKYTIYTFGVEEWKHIYASIMIFDEQGNDVLLDEQKREKISKYFGKLIRRHNPEKKNFYHIFNKLRK